MDYLLGVSHRPPVVVTPETSVFNAVETMSKNRVGAVGVVAGGTIIGIFTERDLMERVVLPALDPHTTVIREVMTTPVSSVRAGDDPDEALETMVVRHIRHLPVTDDQNRILGMLSVRNLLQDRLDKARREAETLEAFVTADGPGG